MTLIHRTKQQGLRGLQGRLCLVSFRDYLVILVSGVLFRTSILVSKEF